MAELPERELSLYGVTKWLDSSALLRWGDSLAEFSWSFGGPLIVEPQLRCWDVDSDGQEEVVVINHVGSGTGTSIEELHVVKKDGDGTLTDYCFPESLWQEDLSGLLSVVSDGDRTSTVLGADLVALTDEIQTKFPDLNPGMIEDASTGRWANFSVQSGTDGNGSDLFFTGSAMLEGREIPYDSYAAEITAAISYENGSFTLSDFHLNSLS